MTTLFTLLRCVFSLLILLVYPFVVCAEISQADAANGELNVQLSTFHELRGDFTLPLEEPVKLSIRSKMSGAYDVDIRFYLGDTELQANFDLVEESMALDGGNYILKAPEKKAMAAASQALSLYLQQEYDDEFPEHSFLAVQMLAYWSKAPKGFAIGHREIETR